MNEFEFDPRVFIRPPYITCPNCAAEEQFGVLMIGWGYTRRCRECWFTERYDLPEIRKKVIYLDQMAISEMMKALNPASPAYERVDPFWRELFEELDVQEAPGDRVSEERRRGGQARGRSLMPGLRRVAGVDSRPGSEASKRR